MPAICTINDLDVPHCGSMKRTATQGNVYVNGKAVSCKDDLNTPHLVPAGRFCAIHAAPITIGSTSVKIGGKGVGRVGDPLTGCTSVATGSSNVFAGG
jgi:uncharacterized Zn-binding protein involved in type VI secretion